ERRTLPASAMTVGSWHLIGRALTLAMALARHCTNPFVPLSAWEVGLPSAACNRRSFGNHFHLVTLRLSDFLDHS
ncbi:hypothetical protein FB451DRAFT_1227171, partial [Mycena latifolia]